MNNATVNPFAEATRRKLRFTFRGPISVEDLWDLNREQLDQMYARATATKRLAEGDSLIQRRTAEVVSDDDLRIQVIRLIFDVKSEELDALRQARERAARRQRIMEIIAEKQDSALASKSLEELNQLLDAQG